MILHLNDSHIAFHETLGFLNGITHILSLVTFLMLYFCFRSVEIRILNSLILQIIYIAEGVLRSFCSHYILLHPLQNPIPGILVTDGVTSQDGKQDCSLPKV
jgi:hypothetical protein